jgi:hypothetical protein
MKETNKITQKALTAVANFSKSIIQSTVQDSIDLVDVLIVWNVVEVEYPAF